MVTYHLKFGEKLKKANYYMRCIIDGLKPDSYYKDYKSLFYQRYTDLSFALQWKQF